MDQNTPLKKDIVPNIHVYGANHSPWVQAVLLTLHMKNLKYSLSCFHSIFDKMITAAFAAITVVVEEHLTMSTAAAAAASTIFLHSSRDP